MLGSTVARCSPCGPIRMPRTRSTTTSGTRVRRNTSASIAASTTDRAPLLESKAAAQLAAGVDAFVVWNFEPNPIPGCSYAVLAGDPLIAGLHT